MRYISNKININEKSTLLQFIKQEWIILIVLCFGISYFYFPYNMYVMILLYPILFIKSYFLKYVDVPFILLMLFSIFYVIFGCLAASIKVQGLDNAGGVVYYLLYPCLFYWIGAYFFNKYQNSDIRIFLLLILIISYALRAILLIVFDMRNGEIISESRKIEFDIYGNEISVMNATLYGLILSIPISGIGMFFIGCERNIEKVFKCFFIVLSVLAVIATIHLQNRGGLFVVFSCTIVSFFYFIRGKFLNNITVILIIAFSILCMNTELKTTVYDAFSQRNQQLDANVEGGGGRFIRWSWGVQNLVEFPFGYDNEVTKARNTQAHNLWLDSGRIAGVIPMFILIFFTLISLKNFFLILKIKKIQPLLLCLLLNLNISFFLSSLIEPVIEGYFIHFLFYIMLFGAQNGIIRNTFIAN